MRARKKSEGFNLAFLDIMACGLGAVILVFMLVKHQITVAPPTPKPEPDTMSESASDIQQLQSRADALRQTLQQLNSQYQDELAEVTQLRQRVTDLQRTLAQRDADLASGQRALENIKQDIARIRVPARQDDLLSSPQRRQEDYLLGLRVEGQKIALLIDSSASMSAERLIDIIKIKTHSVRQKRQAQKWQRTLRTVRWLLARLPRDSQVAVTTFADNAKSLSEPAWLRASDQNALKQVLARLQTLSPEGSTNLQRGLKLVAGLQPSDLYLITDGLPTSGDSRYAGLNPFSKCRSLLGRAATISGECRVKLFRHTLSESAPKQTRVNIILLPIEGDPEAASEYWRWSSSTGGLLIHPARGWP